MTWQKLKNPQIAWRAAQDIQDGFVDPGGLLTSRAIGGQWGRPVILVVVIIFFFYVGFTFVTAGITPFFSLQILK